ncbi:hypothetical protein NLJ89_g4920 [Agrocybe chaxingu]|uniref:Large ribosomal subunit protein uL29m n=1 Tax=Agrocybe chaxingu TaxID=84603 RepID=A0A9W8K839_9AGAR|nr:hypothetical protein NLJ89_g4920 [Agrocybe chaxingu]
MFSLCRSAARPISRPLTRGFAEVVSADSSSIVVAQPLNRKRRKPRTPKPGATPKAISANGKVPVREDHGLYAFFRRKEGEDLVGEDRFEVVETPESAQILTGRAWEAVELRNKSFKDLHTLWYVSLREKNLLATQREEARRMGVQNVEAQSSIEKSRHCRKTMGRIKAVLNERRLAYEGAVKLAEKELEFLRNRPAKEYTDEDKQVLEYQRKKRADRKTQRAAKSVKEKVPSTTTA